MQHCNAKEDAAKLKKLGEIGKELKSPLFLVKHGAHVVKKTPAVIKDLRAGLKGVKD